MPAAGSLGTGSCAPAPGQAAGAPVGSVLHHVVCAHSARRPLWNTRSHVHRGWYCCPKGTTTKVLRTPSGHIPPSTRNGPGGGTTARGARGRGNRAGGRGAQAGPWVQCRGGENCHRDPRGLSSVLCRMVLGSHASQWQVVATGSQAACWARWPPSPGFRAPSRAACTQLCRVTLASAPAGPTPGSGLCHLPETCPLPISGASQQPGSLAEAGCLHSLEVSAPRSVAGTRGPWEVHTAMQQVPVTCREPLWLLTVLSAGQSEQPKPHRGCWPCCTCALRAPPDPGQSRGAGHRSARSTAQVLWCLVVTSTLPGVTEHGARPGQAGKLWDSRRGGRASAGPGGSHHL